ncbi:hypothetical protein CCACVL1_19654 [Corchorus capsularis]|uniref:C2H2-type domain-containing protein n=1 Tax=Corchorus capsularis TaxID=210143 RepID=A0A1R3HFR6_COCAP|nr:hypothetical protein CCACVL1_19654 [Corchorus capsularis]
MAMNFNHCNSASSLGLSLGLGNEAIDLSLVLSPPDSNSGLNRFITDGTTNGLNFDRIGQSGLISETITQVKKTFVSPYRSVQMVQSAVDYAPLQLPPSAAGFPLTDFTFKEEIVKTTRFLSPASTMERLFASNNGVRNQGIFPTNGGNGGGYTNQVMNPFPSLNSSRFLDHEANFNGFSPVKREPVFDSLPFYPMSQNSSSNQGLTLGWRNSDHNLNYSNYMNFQERQQDEPIYAEPISQVPVAATASPPQILGSNVTLEEMSDENDFECPVGYDGRTHSLRDNPDGKYGCPNCSAAFDTSQEFASHVQSHYQHETEDQRKRRMAAKCRRKRLRLVESPHGLTAVPDQSFKRRDYGKEKFADIIGNPVKESNNGRLGGVIIKEEPM